MKTIEEAAKEYQYPYNSKYGMWAVEITEHVSRNSFKKGVEFAQSWIPVKEENPPLDESLSESEFKYSITVEVKNGIKIQSAYFNTETGQWRSLITGNIINPTHWRQINLK